jgi:hypothetical protein
MCFHLYDRKHSKRSANPIAAREGAELARKTLVILGFFPVGHVHHDIEINLAVDPAKFLLEVYYEFEVCHDVYLNCL